MHVLLVNLPNKPSHKSRGFSYAPRLEDSEPREERSDVWLQQAIITRTNTAIETKFELSAESDSIFHISLFDNRILINRTESPQPGEQGCEAVLQQFTVTILNLSMFCRYNV